ncbi:coiled-coil domain-containing protein 25 [Terfezia claveryi]|nr:coiled-coil domain-containing protein 25 [Terfezia claveryi]
MVLYFKSDVVDPPRFIYMGKDKFENEELIKYGWEEDFHVDKLSSAHIYLRLKANEAWDEIPQEVVIDCAQLTKANSIEGNKKDNVTIIYTPWSNLKKDGSMAVGQVAFKDSRKVKRVLVETRVNAIVNRLNKTKEEKHPDLAKEKEEMEKEKREEKRQLELERKKEEARVARERKEKAYQRDHMYDDLFQDGLVEASSNQNKSADFYDDFM